MDQKEKAILQHLLVNCRMSYRKLGGLVGLTGSSVKKRIDLLMKSGFIQRFLVYINPDSSNLRFSNVIAYTDSSIGIESFTNAVRKHEGMYLVYPFTSGDFYVGFDYSKDKDLDALCSTIEQMPGVLRIERFKQQLADEKEFRPDAPEFTLNEAKVLDQLLVDARMPDHLIAANSGLPIKMVRRILDDFENGDRLWFTLAWNPNLGRNITFTCIIRHKADRFSGKDFLDWLDTEFPSDYWATRDYPSQQTMFSFFVTERLPSMEEASQAILSYPGVESCSTHTHYTAFNRNPLIRTRLERLVEQKL
ncbi:MAG: Lrp/AsnC family transcriptional regulator [Candidatus Thorarchaeota archaeon]|nr:MAG: Lrp/AsnC family transcriptional regulator [Candidatus Thorarchaeota archaeon]